MTHAIATGGTVPSGPDLRVAVVGSGPAGFFAAGRLLAGAVPCTVDMFDRLATPGGLVRAGVAPDHPNIKAVFRVFESTSAKPGFRFFGNVEIGTDLGHDVLAAHYDVVLYAVGAMSSRRLGVPGEDLDGVHPAAAFVAWYNGHPDYADRRFDLSGERAVVVGNGNVALDVARMLVTDTASLAATDVADHALEALRASRIREVTVLGRRSGAFAAFTDPELVELTRLAGVELVADPAEIAHEGVRRHLLDRADATAPAPRRIVLRFLASPAEIIGAGTVSGVRVARTAMATDADGRPVAVPTAETEILPADLVLTAVGYRGEPITGVPHDAARGTVSNVDGRVTDPATGLVVPGAYTAGWAKRGPSGIIGTNKKCAHDTVAAILADHAAGLVPRAPGDPSEVAAVLGSAGHRVVGWGGWRAIDEAERAAAAGTPRPRVKLVHRDALMAAAGAHH